MLDIFQIGCGFQADQSRDNPEAGHRGCCMNLNMRVKSGRKARRTIDCASVSYRDGRQRVGQKQGEGERGAHGGGRE